MNTVLDDISAEIGFINTTIIVAVYGGTHLYVPEVVSEDHPLAKLVGLPAMDALVKCWKKKTVFIPANRAAELVRRDRAIFDRLTAGARPKEVAAELGISRRRVEQLKVQFAA